MSPSSVMSFDSTNNHIWEPFASTVADAAALQILKSGMRNWRREYILQFLQAGAIKSRRLVSKVHKFSIAHPFLKNFFPAYFLILILCLPPPPTPTCCHLPYFHQHTNHFSGLFFLSRNNFFDMRAKLGESKVSQEIMLMCNAKTYCQVSNTFHQWNVMSIIFHFQHTFLTGFFSWLSIC